MQAAGNASQSEDFKRRCVSDGGQGRAGQQTGRFETLLLTKWARLLWLPHLHNGRCDGKMTASSPGLVALGESLILHVGSIDTSAVVVGFNTVPRLLDPDQAP